MVKTLDIIRLDDYEHNLKECAKLHPFFWNGLFAVLAKPILKEYSLKALVGLAGKKGCRYFISSLLNQAKMRGAYKYSTLHKTCCVDYFFRD